VDEQRPADVHGERLRIEPVTPSVKSTSAATITKALTT
jgi:hypothetical protein